MCRSFKDLVDVLVIDPALREKCARFHSSTLFLRELFGLFGNKSTRDCHTILCASFSQYPRWSLQSDIAFGKSKASILIS